MVTLLLLLTWTRTNRCTAMLTCVAAALTILVAPLLPPGTITVQARPVGEVPDIEVHLNRLNKPALKSITIEDGEIIDCIDIYEQPAFDHPLLKNHTIIMSPNFGPNTGKILNNSRRHRIVQPKWQESDEGCPDGTIPMRRVQKSDLIRASSWEGFGRRFATGNDEVAAYELVERAGVFLAVWPYNGARADIGVWPVQVENDEWSHANMELNDGIDGINFIEAGWLANPSLYGDARPRLYTYWTTDGYHETGCYNLLCPGFVQVGKAYVLGNALEPVSVYDGQLYHITATINKDDINRMWWLVIQGEPVGYWPMSIFVNGGFEHAEAVKWGGAVLNKRKLEGTHTTTQMGSGHYADEGWGKAASFMNLQVINTDNTFFPWPSNGLYPFWDNRDCYSVEYENATVVYYGGPGGHDC